VYDRFLLPSGVALGTWRQSKYTGFRTEWEEHIHFCGANNTSFVPVDIFLLSYISVWFI
jgi:hypothetical protein